MATFCAPFDHLGEAQVLEYPSRAGYRNIVLSINTAPLLDNVTITPAQNTDNKLWISVAPEDLNRFVRSFEERGKVCRLFDDDAPDC
jgi:hypothetical protein